MALYAIPSLALRERSIRVVRLHCHIQNYVCLDMRIVDLDSNDNEYVGLSYMWGEALPSRTVLVNGIAVSIRQSLFDFLSELKRQKKTTWYG